MAKRRKRRKRNLRRSQRQTHFEDDFVKVGNLLRAERLQALIKRANYEYEQPKRRREDPRIQESRLQEHYRKQKARRDAMLSAIAAREREARRYKGPQLDSDSKPLTEMRSECNRRSRVRSALFSKNKIGSGKKVSDKRIYTEKSKIKC